MAGTLAPNPVFHGWDDNGDPLAGGTLTTYAAGTTTLLATYSESTLTTANANPIVLNSAGRAVIYLLPAAYKWVLKNSVGTTIWTQDNISAVPPSNTDLDISGVAGEALTAGKAVYLSAGDGGRTAGRWYLADADLVYASTGADALGMVTTDLAIGETGSIRRAGRVTGLSGLTAGAVYYISATAGAITATAPTNARRAGVADSTTSLVFGEVRNTRLVRIAGTIATVGNITTGEDTLFESIRPAGELASDSMSWLGSFWGHSANTANAKTLRLRLIEGANNAVIASASLTTSEAGDWRLTFEAKRASATLALASSHIISGPGGAAATISTVVVNQPTATFANAITLRVTGEATATNDITLEGGTVTLVP